MYTTPFTINGTDYVYTEVSGDTFDTVLSALATKINSSNNGKGDPNVIAQIQTGFQFMVFVARVGGHIAEVRNPGGIREGVDVGARESRQHHYGEKAHGCGPGRHTGTVRAAGPTCR